MTPDSEEMLGPDRDTWGFFGLTIDSTVTRVITDLETKQQADPDRTAILVLDGCRPTAAVPQPPCPTTALVAMEQIALAGVAMATQPPTVAAPGATTNNDPADGQTGGATTNANWRENEVVGAEDNDGIIAAAIFGEKMSEADQRAPVTDEIKILSTSADEFTEPPATTETTTMAKLEEEKRSGEEKLEESTTGLPPPVTLRLNLRVRDAVPTEIAHGILVVKPQSKVEIALPNLDPQTERVQVDPLVVADMDIFADTVDAVRQLVGVRAKEIEQVQDSAGSTAT